MHQTDDHPEAVRSDPVPVPRPDDQDDRIPHQLDADHAADNRTDWDGDGRPDGVTDPDATRTDWDGDGRPDGVTDPDPDADRDGDGVADADATHTGWDGATDTDRDGVADNDTDRDGVTDADRDGDGVADADAARTDWDGDGRPDGVADNDADRDGVADADATRTDWDGATDTDRDGDGVTDPDATRTDWDGDGRPDGDGVTGADPEATLADRGTFDDPVVADTDRDGDLFTADADADRDGVPDSVDAAYADRSGNPDPDAAVQDGGTFDDPVVASPVEVDPDRDDTYTEPGLAETALGGAAAGAAAGAAVGAAGDRRDDDDTLVQDAPAEMKPGDAEAEPVVTLMSADATQGFRDRWRDVQLRFVDDPRGAAGEAQTLAEEAVEALVEALSSHKNDLGGWQTTEAGDTEQLRVVVRRYRDLLDRVLGS